MTSEPHPIGVDAPPFQFTDEQQVVFLHIPKTAGTTFMNLLYHFFPKTTFCPWYYMDNIPDKIEGYKVYAGHLYYDVIRRFVKQDAFYLTFLRDPIERTISNYYEIKKDAEKSPEKYSDFPDTLEKFIFDPNYANQLTNLQTRLLSQEMAFSDLTELSQVWHRYNDAISIHEDVTDEQVRSVLDRLHFVGITERFNESLALLFYTLGWEPIFDQERLNIGTYQAKAKNLPAHVLARIIDMNRQDIKLYEQGKTLFQERFDQMLRKFSTQNYHLTQVIKVAPHISPFKLIRPRTVIAEPLSPSGFMAEISIDETPLKLKANKHVTLKPRVKNISQETWPSLTAETGRYAIRLGCYWKTGEEYLPNYETRANLPYDLHPDEHETITIMLFTPAEPGNYTAYLSMMQEEVAWFTESQIELSIEVY